MGWSLLGILFSDWAWMGKDGLKVELGILNEVGLFFVFCFFEIKDRSGLMFEFK